MAIPLAAYSCLILNIAMGDEPLCLPEFIPQAYLLVQVESSECEQDYDTVDYYAFPKSLTAEKLKELSANESDDIAVISKWVLLNYMPRDTLKTPTEFKNHYTALSYEFVGFLEGRLRTSVPKWVRRIISEAVTAKYTVPDPNVIHDNVVQESVLNVYESEPVSGFGPNKVKSYLSPLHNEGNGPTAEMPNLHLNKSEDTLELKLKTSVGIEKYVINNVKHKPRYIYSAHSAPNTIVITADSRGQGDRIHCIDNTTKKVIWSNHTSTMKFNGGLGGGMPLHIAEIVIDDHKVYVYSVTLFRIIVESFDLVTGNEELYFHSDYTSYGCEFWENGGWKSEAIDQ